ncbi:GGDEF domain-containing protein [Anaerorhabdus sp.]|uniref:GGDEF domain-containing protein n=1 Tax=Anaerorhabdus sp. TaxID=1872524 RepID=UPI002FCAB16C
MDSKNQNIIMEFASLLYGNETKDEIVDQALTKITSYFNLDSAFNYEINPYGYFELKGSHTSLNINLIKVLPSEIIRTLFESHKSNDFIIVSRDDHDTEIVKLFDMLNTNHIALAAHYHEKRIAELLVYSKNEAFNNMKQELSMVSSMLIKYTMPRIYASIVSSSRKVFEGILDNTGIDIYVNDFYTHEILYVNRSMAMPYGGIEKFKSKKCWEVLFPSLKGQCEFCPQKKLIDDNGDPTKVYTWDYQRELDGSWFRVFSAAFRWVDGRLAHVVSSADITDNKKNEALIKYMANYDSLTGLPNRRMLIEYCNRRINERKLNEKGYVLFFDIDGFKLINDTYGHDSGDEFLISLGQYFQSIDELRGGVYRNGGDEFIGVLDANEGEEELCKLMERVIERFNHPWNLKSDVKVNCQVSIGIACYPDDGATVDDLLANADKAMYQVKRNGGAGYCFAKNIKNR